MQLRATPSKLDRRRGRRAEARVAQGEHGVKRGRRANARPEPAERLTPPSGSNQTETEGTLPTSPRSDALRSALSGVLAELGFQTARLFVRGAPGWELLEQVGPAQPWHGLLDPSALEGTPEAAEYPDARTIPGIGSRLVSLGCASLATLPLPEGGRLLIDSSVPTPQTDWLRRARPYLALISVVAGPDWSSGGGLRNHHEVWALDRAFAVCQDLLAGSGASPDDLLDKVREAVGAHELFVLVQRGDDLDVEAARGEGWPSRLSGQAGAGISEGGYPEEAVVRRLVAALGASSRAVAAGLGREGPQPELLLVGWIDGPAFSAEATAMLARTVSTARSAFLARRQAVSAVIDRERSRMAYALHDGLTQTVAGAILELEALGKRIERDPREAMATLDTSKAEIRQALAELRTVLFDLSQPPDEAIEPAPLTRYVDDVVKRWRLPARVSVEGNLNEIPARTLSVAYVVIREALANAAKHAAGTNVTVNLAADRTELQVVVGDAGRGFTSDDEGVARESHHFGLDMLRRRVREVGGSLTVDSNPGQGTRVIARLPIGDAKP